MLKKFLFSGNVDSAALGLLDANALPTSAPISKARSGSFKTFLTIFFDAISRVYRENKNSPNFSAAKVLSLTVMGFFLLQFEH